MYIFCLQTFKHCKYRFFLIEKIYLYIQAERYRIIELINNKFATSLRKFIAAYFRYLHISFH